MRKTLLLALLVFIHSMETKAQPGTLDPTFGTNGHVNLEKNFIATAFANDGKLLGIQNAGSQLLVYRFDANGLPDASFGSGGTVIFAALPTGSKAVSVAVGSDGKVVVLNSLPQTTFGQNAIVRFNNNGAPDPSFGV